MKRVAIVALLVAASAAALPASASADPAFIDPPSTTGTTVTGTTDRESTTPVSTESACWYENAYWAAWIKCGTEVLPWMNGAGRYYWWYVEPNASNVIHLWQAADGNIYGANLGGTAVDGVWVWRHGSWPNGPEIYVVGTDGGLWCNERFSTHWTGWHRC